MYRYFVVFLIFTFPHILAASENLLTNGGAENRASGPLGEKVKIAYEKPFSGEACWFVEKEGYHIDKNRIEVDTTKNYTLSGAFRQEAGQPVVFSFGLRQYDASGIEISHPNVGVISGTDTELAADAMKGDTVIKVKDASKWRKGTVTVIAFDIQKDYSDLPNRRLGMYIKKIILKDGIYEITLSMPLQFGFKANTPVRQHSEGDLLSCGASATQLSTDWKIFRGDIYPADNYGAPRNHFWRGTKYVRVFVWKRGDVPIYVDDLEFKKHSPQDIVLSSRLQVKTLANINTSGNIIRLIYPAATDTFGRIILEAENAQHLVAQLPQLKNGCFLKSPECSGNYGVIYAKSMRHEFTVSQAGKYEVYFRARFPYAAEWNHTEQWNGGVPARHHDFLMRRDAGKIPLEQWLWYKTGEVELQSGENTFQFDFQGGPELDQVALCPPGTAPATSAPLQYGNGFSNVTGSALFSEFMLSPDLERCRLYYEPVFHGGTGLVSYSLDGGETFTSAVPGRELPAVNKDTPLIVKVELKTGENKEMPCVKNLRVEFTVPAELPLGKSQVAAEFIREQKIFEALPDSYTNVRVGTDGTLRFARPATSDASGRIFLSADHADSVILAPEENSFSGKDSELSDTEILYMGHFNKNLVAFDFLVTKPGIYRPFFLVRATNPHALSFLMEFNRVEGRREAFCYTLNSHNHYIKTYAGGGTNTGLGYNFKDYQGMKPLWMPGNKVSLTKGMHSIRLRGGFYYMNFAGIAIVPENERAASGLPIPLPAAAREKLTSARIEYAETTGKLEDIIVAPSEVKTRVEVSFDHGETYQTFRSDMAIPAGHFRIRASFSGKPDSVIPRLKVVTVQRKVISVGNSEQELCFDFATGNLVSWIINGKNDLISPGNDQPLFAFEHGSLKNSFKFCEPAPGNLLERKVSRQNGKTTVEFKYFTGSRALVSTVRIILPSSGAPLWELEILNKTDADVRHIEFPCLPTIRLGRNPETLRMTRTYYMGSFNNPGAMLGFEESVAGYWPGSQSMAYLAVFAPGIGSFTLQNRNPDGYGIRFKFSPNKGCSGVIFGSNRRYTVVPGEKAVIRYLAGFHPGDEHDSCELYGKWAHTWMDFSRVNRGAMKNVSSCAGQSVWWLPPGRIASQTIPFHRWMGADMFFSTRYNLGFTPCFFPRLGTPEEIAGDSEALRRAGIYNFCYWDSYGWSEDYSSEKTIVGFEKTHLPDLDVLPPGSALKGGVKDENGLLRPWGWAISHAKQDNMMCTADALWSNYLKRIMKEHYAKKYGVCVYSDECNAYIDCYDQSHTHGRQYGAKQIGLANIYREVLDSVRKKQPWFALFGEGAVDYLLQYLEFGIRNGADALDGAPLLFAFPEIKLLRGYANHPADGLPGWSDALRDYHLFARNLSGYWCNNTRQFNLHRQRIGDWLYDAVFRDSLGIEGLAPGIQAKYFVRYRAEHQGLIINIHNPFEKAGTSFTLDIARLPDPLAIPVKGEALAYLLDEEAVSSVGFMTKDGKLRLEVPSVKASSILLPVKMPPSELLRVSAVWPQKTGRDSLNIYVKNFAAAQVKAKLKLEIPSGLKFEKIPDSLRLAAGEFKKIEMLFSGVSNLKKHSTLKIFIDGRNVENVIIAPPISNPSFENHPPGDFRPDYWGCDSFYFIQAYQQVPDSPPVIREVGGTLDSKNPFDGEFSLKLLPPTMPIPFSQLLPPLAGPHGIKGWPRKPLSLPYYYNAGQYLILKPGTEYVLRFRYRFENPAGKLVVQGYPYTERKDVRSLTFPAKTIESKSGDALSWQRFEITFQSPNPPVSSYLTVLAFVNVGKGSLWIDAVELEERVAEL